MKLPRESYYPSGAVEIDTQETDAAIFAYDEGDKLYAIAFHGKAQKPDWHYRFRNEEQRQRRIQGFVDGRRERAKMMDERKASRDNPHSLEIGQILVSSWGYDQTNIDYYQVVAKTEKTVVIRAISQAVDHSSQTQDHVVAAKGQFVGEPMTKRVNPQGNSVRIASYAHAYPWDGKPDCQTAAGYGH